MKKLKLKYFLLIILFGISLPLAAQNLGSISGVVIDSQDNSPCWYSSVKIIGTELIQICDVKGKFYFPEIPAGFYTIQATYIGFTTKNIDIEVFQGKETKVFFKLDYNGPDERFDPPKKMTYEMGSGRIITKEWIYNTGIR